MQVGETWKKKFLEPDDTGEYIVERYLEILENVGVNWNGDTEWEVREWWKNGATSQEIQNRTAQYSTKIIREYYNKVWE